MATDARFRDTLKTLLAALGSPEPTRRQKARQTIRDTLAVNQKSWNDPVTSLQFRGRHSDKLKKLFAMLGQDNDGEFDNARRKISDVLARERRTWKAFVDSLFSTSSNAWSDWHDHAASDPAINPLDLVHLGVARLGARGFEPPNCRNDIRPTAGLDAMVRLPPRAARYTANFDVVVLRARDPLVCLVCARVAPRSRAKPRCPRACMTGGTRTHRASPKRMGRLGAIPLALQ
jgi:hypothetical protein